MRNSAYGVFLWMIVVSLHTRLTGAQDINAFHILPTSAKDIREGLPLLLTCSYPDTINNVEWTGLHAEKIVSGKKGIKLDNLIAGQLELIFSSVTPSINGRYTCSGYDTISNKTVAKTRMVTVYEPIKFKNEEKLQQFEQGEDAVVRCEVDGNPEPTTIIWVQGTVNLQGKMGTSRIYKDPTSANLIIRNITKLDEGFYECNPREKSKGQNINQMIFVDVQYGPASIKVQPNVEGVEGKNITLTCSAKAEPKPTYKWYRGGKDDIGPSTEIRQGVEANGTTLVLAKVTSDDQGQYTCWVSNVRGNDSDTTRVTVLIPPKIISTKNDSVKIDKFAFVECIASGSPLPEIVIYKGNRVINAINSTDRPITKTIDSSNNMTKVSLFFGAVSILDTGEYKCVASNKADSATAILNLQVSYPPQNTSLETVYGCPGGSAKLLCQFDAYPTPILEWGTIQNKTIVAPNVTLTNETSPAISEQEFVSFKMVPNYDIIKTEDTLTLKIKQISTQSYGKYYCRATNAEGKNTAYAELVEAGLPDVPTNVAVSAVQTTSAIIVFSLPKNIPVNIVSYRVTLARTDARSRIMKNVTAGKPGNTVGGVIDVLFTGLNHNTEYAAKVEALNCKGFGVSNEPRLFMTKKIVNPEPVAIISSNATHNTSLLRWKVGKAGGGSFKKIKIFYKIISGKHSNLTYDPIVIRNNEKSFQSKSYELKDLQPSTLYDVKMTIFNEVGNAKTEFHIRTAAVSSQVSTQDPRIGEVEEDPGLSMLAIIIIVVVVVVAIIIADLSLCASVHYGVSHFIYAHTCAPAGSMAVKDAEEGERNDGNEYKVQEVVATSNEHNPVQNGSLMVTNNNENEGVVTTEMTPLKEEQEEAKESVTNEEPPPQNVAEGNPPASTDDVIVEVGDEQSKELLA